MIKEEQRKASYTGGDQTDDDSHRPVLNPGDCTVKIILEHALLDGTLMFRAARVAHAF
jgi:hypothetical protein